MRFGGREAVLGFSGEPRRRAPPGAAAGRPLPPRPRLHAIGAVRSARTAQIRKGAYPLDRSTVDRWTGSTAAVHEPASPPRQPRVSDDVSLRQHSQPQPATWRHRSLSAGRPGNFAKRTPSFWKLQIYPSTYQNSYNSVLILMSRPLISLISLF